MLRSYPRLVTECLPLPATLPKQAGKQNRHTQLARPTTAHSVFGQTSIPKLRATGMTSNPKGCSGTWQTPCPPVHGYGQAAQTRGATDIKAPEPRSRGCFVALLYNNRRPHSSLDRKTPDRALLQRADANDGGGIIEAEIHLAKRPKLFRQTEPPPGRCHRIQVNVRLVSST
ncbi:hypothetical protein P3T31_004631 [Rhizobium sp. AN70]|nr:hypothetical protein [Rhizobium sp. AN70]